MCKDEILTRLCIWDVRNPNAIPLSERDNEDPKEKTIKCSCDNCFYGRHQLADYILTLV